MKPQKVVPKVVSFFLLNMFCVAQNTSMTAQQKADHDRLVKYSREHSTSIIIRDTLFQSGVPYCLIKTISNGFFSNDYRVSTLSGKEVLIITKGSINEGLNLTSPGNSFSITPAKNYYYTFYFIPTKQRTEIDNTFGTDISKFIIDNQLLSADSLNLDRVDLFVTTHGTPFSSKSKSTTTNIGGWSGTQPVQSTTPPPAPVFQILENKIYQSGRQISYFTEESGSENGVIYKAITFYMPDGTRIARATSSGPEDHHWSLITFQDNKTHDVNASSGNDANNMTSFLLTFHYM